MRRRRFLEALAAGAGVASCPGLARAASKPDCSFPVSGRERLAVASYPFRKDVDPKHGKVKLLDFPQLVAERFNVRGIEPLDEHFPSTDAAYLAQFRNALAKANAHVVNIPVGRLHGSFYDPDEAKRKVAIGNARKWVDVAAALGSPGIRVHIQAVTGVTPDVDRAAQSLTEVAAYGQERNVVINLENDDPATEDAFYIVKVIEQAQSPWLRALPDFCNSMLLKQGEDYNYRAVTAMFQHACTISHAKEIETDEGKLYRVDVARTYAIAKTAGYRGYFSMEWDSEGDPYAGTEKLIKASLQALGA